VLVKRGVALESLLSDLCTTGGILLVTMQCGVRNMELESGRGGLA